ncbi:MAG: T9SS type A sorting domain-containing protein, partial [Prevotella sp.]|nr:T9SS type A sorting domain-containing protein [Prevotella sp.]
ELAADIPVVYTVTGRLATSVNRLNSFTCLPLGVESNSEEYCTLTFTGVDNLSTLNSHLYDAYLETLTPISEGMQVRVPGQTQNRFFIVCGTPQVGVSESNIQIYDEGGMVHVLSTTTAPLTSVRAYDTAGRLVYSNAPNKAEHTFRLPKGVYIIEGLTARDRKTLKQSIY